MTDRPHCSPPKHQPTALTRAELAVELRREHMELRAAIVFVTHSARVAVLLADRVAVLTAPGSIREIVNIDIPRPRSFGVTAHTDEVADRSARLHDMLLAGHTFLAPTARPTVAVTPALASTLDCFRPPLVVRAPAVSARRLPRSSGQRWTPCARRAPGMSAPPEWAGG